MAQRVWGGWRCDKLTQTGNFYPCRRYPCGAIVPEVLPTGDRRFGVKIGERNANLGIWIWGCRTRPQPTPNPCRSGRRQAARGGGEGGQAFGTHTYPRLALPPRCLFRENVRSTTPPFRPRDLTHLQSYTHLRLQHARCTSASPCWCCRVRLSQQAAAGSSIWYLLHLQLQLPGFRGFDTHFPAAATPVLSTNIVVNVKYHSTYLSVWSSRC